MIVIGVDVHKQSVTAVAVDEAGRMLDEKTVAVGSDELIGWAFALGAERLWALEDCRGLTRWLEQHWPTAVFRTIYVWRREYAPADASAGRSATACAVTLYTSGAATARIAERSLGARSLCMGTGPPRRLR